MTPLLQKLTCIALLTTSVTCAMNHEPIYNIHEPISTILARLKAVADLTKEQTRRARLELNLTRSDLPIPQVVTQQYQRQPATYTTSYTVLSSPKSQQ